MYGLTKICQSQSVTETSAGLVLGAVQNNSGIEGTLSNRISKLESVKNRSCIIKSSSPSFVCNGAAVGNPYDGVRIHLLNNGMHIISGLLDITDLDVFLSTINSGEILMSFPSEYAFINNFSGNQTWSAIAISVNSARTFPIRIPANTANLYLWGPSTTSAASLVEKTAYQLFGVY